MRGADQRMKLDDRIAAVVSAAAEVAWLGELTLRKHHGLDRAGAGSVFAAIPSLQPYGNQHCLTLPLSPISAYCQREYPARGFAKSDPWSDGRRHQLDKNAARRASRSRNFCQALPKELRPDLATDLDPHWMEEAEVIVVFGSDETVREFSERVLPSQRFLAHGHKISLGLIWGRCDPQHREGIARDVFSFDQLGCLSPQFFYVAGDSAEFAYATLQAPRKATSKRLTTTVREPCDRRRSSRVSRRMEISCRHRIRRLLLGKSWKSGLGGDS